MIIGIDYGSKLAGTTVIAFLKKDRVTLLQSEKKKDADRLIREQLALIKEPAIVGFDAPLSLPGVYRSVPDCINFHYRQCDRELGAMSPLFLGGLTARAMQLKYQLESDRCSFFETYPAAQAKRLSLEKYGYKKPDAQYKLLSGAIANELHIDKLPEFNNSHQVDALLALLGAQRIANQKATPVGLKEEGLIYV